MENVEKYTDKFKIDEKLCINFFLLFSRFEYCLKRSGYIISTKDNNCHANWDDFFKKNKIEIEKIIEEKKEPFEYLLNNPPKKQFSKGHEIYWKDAIEKNNVIAINIYLRRVRNNLFHGGKYQFGAIDEIARNNELLKNAIDVIIKLIEIDDNIKTYFEPE